MKIEKAIEILEKWQSSGFGTRIDDMDPALNLSIEALKCLERLHNLPFGSPLPLLPGETRD